MKQLKLNLTFLLTLLMGMVGAKASAHDIEMKNADGVTIYYRWNSDKTELAVSYRDYKYNSYSNEYSGNVIIPSSVTYCGKEYSVTSIGADAFRDCSGLTSVAIPNSVTSIGSNAFDHCTGLTSVTIGNSVKSIDGSAFVVCSGLTKIEVASYNTTYDSRTNCNAIIETASNTLIAGCQNSIIPNGVTSIGSYAFCGRSGLTSITIPNSVTSIGSYAFGGCSGLTSLTIPDSVTSIGDRAFEFCTGLTSIEIGNSVTSIGDFAFYDCSSLSSVEIPSSVMTIGNYAFWNSSGRMTKIVVASDNMTYDSRGNCNAIIETASNTLIIGCQNTVIPNSVTGIDKGAFAYCTNLASIEIPNSVTTIGINAFYYCPRLTSVEIPNSVTTIGSYAFYDCYGLTSVEIPNSVTTIGSYAFYDCSHLTSVGIPNSVTSIGDGAFSYCSGLTSVEIPNSVTSIGEQAFSSCSGLKSVEIPNSVMTIGHYAFSGCSHLTSVTSLIEEPFAIIYYTFENNTYKNATLYVPAGTKEKYEATEGWKEFANIVEIDVPQDVIEVKNADGVTIYYRWNNDKTELAVTYRGDNYDRYKNEYSGNVTIPASVTYGGREYSVTSIDDYAFYGCSALTEVHLPSSLRSIGSSAFSGCTALKDYYVYTIEPTSIEESTFSNWNTATLHVPRHAYNNYFVTRPWSKFYPNLVQDNDYKYQNFYLTQDYVFNDAVGAMDSTPDVQLDGGSGLIVETTNSTVKLEEVHMADNGTASASIIADNNLIVENLYFDMAVTANRWYFLSFPFRVKLNNVTTPGRFVFRYYDGQERATNGKGGWKNVTDDYLNANQGYIFQTDTAGTLTLKVEKADLDFSGGERQDVLTTYTASSTQHASWNFLGNPHSSYYDIDDTGYDAPITVWNGSTYQAVRAGDDQYHLAPFQAFFVQKPEGTASVRFPASGRHTYSQWADRIANKQSAGARAAMGVSAQPRKVVNLTIGNGEQVDDQTRVVFNSAKSTAYEMDCDASKFFSDQPVAQLYTVDTEGTQYAINECPEGEVNLGFVATDNGDLCISAVRMDRPVYLRDNEKNTIHDLSLGGYTFTADQGTNESRFTLLTNNSPLGIADIEESTQTTTSVVYDLQGRRVKNGQSAKGLRIVKDGQKVTKVVGK